MAETNEALRPLDDSLTRILVENHKAFRAFLAKRVGDEAIAEDLLQASLSKAIESPSESGDTSTVVAWFYRILKNTLIDYYRSHAAEARKNDAFLQELTAIGQTQQRPMDEIEAVVCACMNRLLPTLKDSYAEVIRRVDLDGQSMNEAALALGISENNLGVRLHRARDALRTSLERTCGTCTEHGCLDCTCD